jgi:aminoglycoside phosphotransferase
LSFAATLRVGLAKAIDAEPPALSLAVAMNHRLLAIYTMRPVGRNGVVMTKSSLIGHISSVSCCWNKIWSIIKRPKVHSANNFLSPHRLHNCLQWRLHSHQPRLPMLYLARGARIQASLSLRRNSEKKRAAQGLAASSDESESEDELEPGAVILHKMFNRKVILSPDNTVIKVGKRIVVGEAEALKVAAQFGIPAPRIHDVHTTSDGEHRITMDYIEGQTLEKAWDELSTEQRKDIAKQLRKILDKMRSATPPPNLISACDGTEIRDTRHRFSYHSPPCVDEKGFNEVLMSGVFPQISPLVRAALAQRLRTSHRIVLTHCDLMPRNIMVKDGKIVGLLDWEDAGWYPEYWEYVKFFHRPGEREWKQYAEDIFSDLYPDELVDYIALSHWQNP